MTDKDVERVHDWAIKVKLTHPEWFPSGFGEVFVSFLDTLAAEIAERGCGNCCNTHCPFLYSGVNWERVTLDFSCSHYTAKGATDDE